ncbi:MAG: acylneuraminate cytidylyltransferase family protein [Flavobacteriales bacterium]|nr:acylneuraminate cytidylyltransferase family protein [Flavobacteriales bacterium]
MKVLGIIPARGGSKGVPRKNIKLLDGKPLIQYTFESAKESKSLTDIILSSEDEEIIEVAKKIGLEVPFVRPKELSEDISSSIDVVIHAVKELEKQGKNYDAICLLQPSSPFRENGSIDKAITIFNTQKTDSLISVLKVPHEFNPHWVFEKNNEGNLKIATGEKEIIKRRQELPNAYFRDGSIYITRTSTILNEKSFYGDSISYYESNSEFYCNIDTLEDWGIAEKKVKSLVL